MVVVLWRAVTLAVAVFALFWAAAISKALPTRNLLGLAQGVQLGQVYPSRDLKLVLAETSDGDCRVEVRRSALLLNLLLFDRENRGDAATIEGEPLGARLQATRSAAKALLECAPSDGLGWLALYLTSIRQSGFGPDAVAELAATYRNAPHEAWLQTLRLPAVLAVYQALPPQLQQMAIGDFNDLLSGGMLKAVASLIAGSPRAMRETLLDQVCSVSRVQQAVVNNELEKLSQPVARCSSASSLPDRQR